MDRASTFDGFLICRAPPAYSSWPAVPRVAGAECPQRTAPEAGPGRRGASRPSALPDPARRAERDLPPTLLPQTGKDAQSELGPRGKKRAPAGPTHRRGCGGPAASLRGCARPNIRAPRTAAGRGPAGTESCPGPRAPCLPPPPQVCVRACVSACRPGPRPTPGSAPRHSARGAAGNRRRAEAPRPARWAPGLARATRAPRPLRVPAAAAAEPERLAAAGSLLSGAP